MANKHKKKRGSMHQKVSQKLERHNKYWWVDSVFVCVCVCVCVYVCLRDGTVEKLRA